MLEHTGLVHVVLVRPEIAPNTGNIIRLCANVGATLHLIQPLGFTLDDRLLRRGGLDYHELTAVHVHPGLGGLLGDLGRMGTGVPFAFSSSARRRFDEPTFGPDDVFVFGAERSGLSPTDLEGFSSDRLLRLPMRPGNRSLNLANAVAVVVYEAWRQQGFHGAADPEGSTGGRGLTSETPGGEAFDR
ncbi:MAG: tRNA (cytidine(34)-2'-O)-methyltransferase [Actinomycetota bacterium]|nr:tRNA (cytidine(34)-2'-O)-methyltransferase [Actinomycetota bacterium]